MKIKWTTIEESNVCGYKTTVNGKSVEVVRMYAGVWTIFGAINPLDYFTFNQAKKYVREALS